MSYRMRIRQLLVGPMQNFIYVLYNETSKEALMIDSGWETEPMVSVVRELGLRPVYAVVTHEHFDHSQTIEDLAARTGAKVVAHISSHLHHDVGVKHGDKLRIGKSEVTVLHTPGHTKDSICLYDGKNLFTGDTLFVGSWGRTDLAGGSAEELYDSLHKVILLLPRDTTIFPGHDYGDVPSRTVGEESTKNPALRAKNLDEFLVFNR